MKNCEDHIIGQYDHSSSEYYQFRLGSDCDGLNMHHTYFKFCPACGAKITKAVIKKQEAL